MAGWVGIDLEVVTRGRPVRRSEHSGAELHHVSMSGGEVFDPEVQMHLLRWIAVWPFWSKMVRGQLDTNTRLAIDRDRVPGTVPLDLAAKDAGPEGTLGFEIRCVEAHHLVPDVHSHRLSILEIRALVPANCKGPGARV